MSTSASPVVRPARPEDAAAIAAVAAATFPDACPPALPAAAVAEHIAAHLNPEAVAGWIADPTRIVLVGEPGAPEAVSEECSADVAGEAAARVLGYAMLETAASPEPAISAVLGSTPAGHLSKVYVLPAARGTGLAEALVRAGVARLRAQGLRHVWLGTNGQNLRANAFYERLGFRRVGARSFVVGGVRVDDDLVRLLTLD